tara:strand:- start:192 stop:1520 length:1329 start_codon:yes stop_codon:yes gene_type:complete
MGSVFVTQPDRTIKGFAGAEYPVPFYLQFVPGNVVEPVHSEESLRYNGPNTINSIIAVPHYSDKVYKTRASAGEDYRYYPLLRGITDIPSKGDPVLLCTIGKVKYYLGPINTNTNNPTWNDDPSFTPEKVIGDVKIGPTSPRGINGQSLNFNKDVLYSRMGKDRKLGLDSGPVFAETTGDMLLEGRHGNSVRIGSRNNNPYIFISNQRVSSNTKESIKDGSLISITSNGSLRQHFNNLIGDNGNQIQFQFDSDKLTSTVNRMGDVWSEVNGGVDANELYLYGSRNTEEFDELGNPIFEGLQANQILFHSDRISLNTKLDDIFMSSKKDIHIGAGRHLTFTTSGGPDVDNIDSVIFQSSNVNIGNPNRKKMEPMVLGEALQAALTGILDLISKLEINTGLGPQIATLSTGEVGFGGQKLEKKLTEINTQIKNITSNFHKIEGN